MYVKTLYAGWADMDFNSHMKNTAYLDKAADVRQMFLAENGFPVEEFLRLRIGPVIMKDEVEYFKEVGLQQVITGDLCARGPRRGRQPLPPPPRDLQAGWEARARVTSTGGWLNLAERKLDRAAAGAAVGHERAREDQRLRGPALEHPGLSG